MCDLLLELNASRTATHVYSQIIPPGSSSIIIDCSSIRTGNCGTSSEQTTLWRAHRQVSLINFSLFLFVHVSNSCKLGNIFSATSCDQIYLSTHLQQAVWMRSLSWTNSYDKASRPYSNISGPSKPIPKSVGYVWETLRFPKCTYSTITYNIPHTMYQMYVYGDIYNVYVSCEVLIWTCFKNNIIQLTRGAWTHDSNQNCLFCGQPDRFVTARTS